MSVAHNHDHSHHPAWLDKLGVTASVLCLIHCLALPLLIPLVPILGLMGHDEVHTLLLFPIVGLAGFGILPGFLRHRSMTVLLAAIAGVLLCSAAVGAEVFFGLHALDVPLTVAGGFCLVGAHLTNLRLTRAARACACAHPG